MLARIKRRLCSSASVAHPIQMEPRNPRPGDHLLDTYFPHADEETRERARDILRKYAVLMVRFGTKLEEEAGSPDSPDGADGVIL